MIYFDVMSWKERFQKHIDQEQKREAGIHEAIREEWARRFVATMIVVEGLRVEDKLNEIKDELWGIGQVRRVNDPNTATVRFELSASWPTYRKAFSGRRIGAYNEWEDVYEPATVEFPKKVIYIDAMALTSKSCKWDEKSVIVGIKNSDSHGMSLTLNAREPITAEELEKTNSLLTQACADISNQYPLTVLIQKDRQVIIEKVLLGELKRSAVPANFGYQFPPEDRKAIELKEPKKRKGLFGW